MVIVTCWRGKSSCTNFIATQMKTSNHYPHFQVSCLHQGSKLPKSSRLFAIDWVSKVEIEQCKMNLIYMDVSENSGTPKSSILIGFSIINHPFWGTTIFGNIHIGGAFKTFNPIWTNVTLTWNITWKHAIISVAIPKFCNQKKGFFSWKKNTGIPQPSWKKVS